MSRSTKQPTRAELDRYLCFLWNEHRALAYALGYMRPDGSISCIPMVRGAELIPWRSPPESRCLPVLEAVGLLGAEFDELEDPEG